MRPSGTFGLRHALLAAALLAATLAPPAMAADSLGRLFTTPEQRNRLELRRQSKVNEVVSVQTDATDVEEPVASYLAIQGQVVRSNGEQTIFINGVPYTGGEAPKGIALKHGKRMGEIVIVPAEGARPVQLKVGQSLDKNSLAIDDALLRAGTITIERPATRPAPARRARPAQ
jgi:hypothetical protein